MSPLNPVPVMGAGTTPVMEEPMGIHPTQISVPPWTILGYRADGRPIYVIAGGAEDDDVVVDDDPEPEVEPDEEPEAGDDPEPEADDKPKPTPPVKKTTPKPGDDDYVPSAAEFRRTKEALAKANLDARRNRERARELEEKTRATETEHERLLREAREEGEKRFREPMKKAGVRAALAEAGFASPDRLLRLVDWDAVSVDDDGDVVGAEAEVDRLRKEYPEFLPAEKPKPRLRPTGAPKPPAEPVRKTSAQIHADKALGRA